MRNNRMFTAVSGGHFAVDVLNSTGAVLLAVLKEPLGLSYAQIGTALTIYLLIGSLSQPLFGWFSDQIRGRSMLLAAVGVAWLAVCFTLVALAPSWALLLPVFLIAPLGSALFHPVGAAAAASAVPDRAASATAIFFFSGQIGLAAGPFLAGALTGRFGAPGLLPLTAMALIPTAILLIASRDEQRLNNHADYTAPNRTAQQWTFVAIATIAAFVTLVALRSSVQAIYQSYLPQLFASRGWEPALFGLLAGVFMGTGAVGQIMTGTLADQYGMRASVVWPMLLSIPIGLVALLTPSVPLTFVACAMAGLLIGGQHSVLVVHAQRLLPFKQGLAAGLILGFTFASGAIGTGIAGHLADTVGIQQVMVAVTFIIIPAALLALTLPGQRQKAQPAPAPVGD